jgi:hypothetical protein
LLSSPRPDVEPLRAHEVGRRHALDEADDEEEAEERGAHEHADHDARDERDDDAHDRRGDDAADVQGQERAPGRVALEHDVLARVQLHAVIVGQRARSSAPPLQLRRSVHGRRDEHDA